MAEQEKGSTVRFVLWRQDDNGNLFAVGSYAVRDLAERQLTELSRSQHKQTYWIAEQGAGGDDD